MSTLRLVLCAAILALPQLGCATGLFASDPPTREQAIRECSNEVPADAVPYVDAFSACMEQRGWAYSGPVGPRQ